MRTTVQALDIFSFQPAVPATPRDRQNTNNNNVNPGADGNWHAAQYPGGLKSIVSVPAKREPRCRGKRSPVQKTLQRKAAYHTPQSPATLLPMVGQPVASRTKISVNKE
jgi:hypothetical protein